MFHMIHLHLQHLMSWCPRYGPWTTLFGKAMQCLVERSPCEAMACVRSFEERVIGFKATTVLEIAWLRSGRWWKMRIINTNIFFKSSKQDHTFRCSEFVSRLSKICMGRLGVLARMIMNLKDPSTHDVKSYGKICGAVAVQNFLLFPRHLCNPSRPSWNMNRTGLPILRRNAW